MHLSDASSPRLGLFDAVRTAQQGGLGELRTVDAEGRPALATSLCSWFAEDESSFLYPVHPSGRHKVKRLKDDTVQGSPSMERW